MSLPVDIEPHVIFLKMYVMDLSGGAGHKCSSVEDQLILRRELRARFSQEAMD